MPRQTRANSGKQETPPPGPVTVRRARREWSASEARDLLRQGYSDHHVADRTGFPLAWVRKQPVPRKSLLERALTGKGFGAT